MYVRIAGFDWDRGNREKCKKHGVSNEEIENLFLGSLWVRPDITHSQTEERFQAVGRGTGKRPIFLIFTIRARQGKRYIRPISARYMHRNEVESYEEKYPGFYER